MNLSHTFLVEIFVNFYRKYLPISSIRKCCQSDNKRSYGLCRIFRKLGLDSDELTDVVNLKLPIEMFGSFGEADRVYPAYHMNKQHWVSVLLSSASDDAIQFLTDASVEVTRSKSKDKNRRKIK